MAKRKTKKNTVKFKNIVKSVDVKYRLTFLENVMFKGEFRQKGTSVTVSKHTKEAYKERTTLKFDLIDNK